MHDTDTSRRHLAPSVPPRRDHAATLARLEPRESLDSLDPPSDAHDLTALPLGQRAEAAMAADPALLVTLHDDSSHAHSMRPAYAGGQASTPAPDAPARTRLELPYPVSVNDLHKPIIRNGRPALVLTPQARAYRDAVAEAVLIQRAKRHRDPTIGATWHGQADVAVTITVTPPDDKKKHDLDNVLKALFDGLKHADVFHDDDQVAELHVKRLTPDGGKGHVVVEITSLEHAA